MGEKLSEFLSAHGDLHDCVVNSIFFASSAARVEVSIEDLHANFGGLSEYPGSQAGRLMFEHVEAVEMDVALPGARIFEVVHTHNARGHRVEFRFSPAGKLVVLAKTVGISPAD
jgi:hypothetical protein